MRSSYQYGDGEFEEPLGFLDELELDSEFEDEEEIVGAGDSRSPIRNTTKAPYRWICRLLITWSTSTPGQVGLPMNVGTGTLIGPKHVLTAGHNVRSQEYGTAREVVVDPGRDLQVLPFGSAKMSRFDVPDMWMNLFDSCYDYALITLDREIGNEVFNGKPLGYWGSQLNGENTVLGPGSLKPGDLRGKTVQMVGYPKDKCEYQAIRAFTRGSKCLYDQAPSSSLGTGTIERDRYWKMDGCLKAGAWKKQATAQFGAKGKVLEAGADSRLQLLLHDVDSCEGQSGGPVWMESGRSSYMLGVHTGVFGKDGRCSDPGRGGLSDKNRAILLTKDVRWNLIKWKVKK